MEKIEGVYYLDNQPVIVSYENGTIISFEHINKLSEDSGGLFIGPGLIDIQVNGYDGVSFSLEGADHPSTKNLSSEAIGKITEELWGQGVTSYFPTITTNSNELILNNIKIISEAINDPANMGSIPGIHLEGPYISPVDGYRGAHPLPHVRKPDWIEFQEFNKHADGKILLVTLAPETEGAFDFIRHCRKNGITVSLGHHNGSAELTHKAVEAGAQLSTHLGNGCATNINRHKNPLWPQLAEDDLNISIISDSFHLPPDILKVFYRVKGPEKIIIITDITSYAGLPAGFYKLKTGETIEKAPNGHLRFSGQDGGLYGSATPMPEALSHMMKVSGCTSADLFRMASVNPAKLLGLSDRGTIEYGKRADLILFSMKDGEMKIHRTIVNGKTVFQS
jgi:N-acetylglucosamine-6-phosphate deacetylase